MPFLMLKPNWSSPSFRRTIRDAQGRVVRVVEFQKGQPVEIDPDEISGLAADIGAALVYAAFDDKDRPRVVASPPADPSATDPSATAESPEPDPTPEAPDAPHPERRSGRRRR